MPDSLTLVSGQGSLRLESYLFTLEAMRTVRDHLKPGGAFAMYNYYTPFVFERYANTMRQAFGHEPCFDPSREDDRRPTAVGPDDRTGRGLDQCATPWHATGATPAPATDDHPFPYILRALDPAPSTSSRWR